MKLTIKDKLTEKSFYNELENKIVEILKNKQESIYRARAGVGFYSIEDIYSQVAKEIIDSLK